MLLNEDYRSRAIGVVAAIGVLITGIVVTGAIARPPGSTPAVKAPPMPREVAVVETGTVPVC